MGFLNTAGALALCAMAASAAGAVSVDGVIDASEYAGAITTVVPYTPGVPTDFSTTNTGSELVAYTVYLLSDATNVYVGMQTSPAGAGLDGHDASLGLTFANLYFSGLKGSVGNIGFQVFNDTAFHPNTGASVSGLTAAGVEYFRTIGRSYADPLGASASVIEVKIPWSVFIDDTLGVPTFEGIGAGDPLRMTISQSFGYSPSSGDGGNGDTTLRFGTLTAPVAAAVPEPASWALMILGFGVVGMAARRRRSALFA